MYGYNLYSYYLIGDAHIFILLYVHKLNNKVMSRSAINYFLHLIKLF